MTDLLKICSDSDWSSGSLTCPNCFYRIHFGKYHQAKTTYGEPQDHCPECGTVMVLSVFHTIKITERKNDYKEERCE